MTELVATSPGLFPLPDWAKDRLSDLKGHQKHDLINGDEGEETVETYEEARSEVIDLQRDAGLDLIGEGQLRWDDMLAHPLAVHDNVETRGIVRYYDNNNFYRDPVVTGDLTFDGDVAAELEAAAEDTDSLQAVLPRSVLARRPRDRRALRRRGRVPRRRHRVPRRRGRGVPGRRDAVPA